MCNTVYLTSKRHCLASSAFKKILADELMRRGVKAVTGNACLSSGFFRKHKTYGVALAFDFYRDEGEGSGLTLNKNCSYIGRDFAYTLSNAYDVATPNIKWRDFNFVDSHNRDWNRYFNKVSSETKAVFYLCSRYNESDWENFALSFDKIIKVFADEIVRCIRSDYNADDYRKRVKLAKFKTRKYKNNGVVSK